MAAPTAVAVINIVFMNEVYRQAAIAIPAELSQESPVRAGYSLWRRAHIG